MFPCQFIFCQLTFVLHSIGSIRLVKEIIYHKCETRKPPRWVRYLLCWWLFNVLFIYCVTLWSDPNPASCLADGQELYVHLVQERDRRVRELQAEMETRAARESLHSSPTPSLSHLSATGSEHFSRSAPILSKCPYAPQQSQLIDIVAASRLYLCPVRSRPETTPCFLLEAVLTHLHIFSR